MSEDDFTDEEAFECANSILKQLKKKKIPPRLAYIAISITHVRIHQQLGLSKQEFLQLAEILSNGVYGKEKEN